MRPPCRLTVSHSNGTDLQLPIASHKRKMAVRSASPTKAPFHWALHVGRLGRNLWNRPLLFCHGWFATETNEHHPVVLYKMFEYLITYQYIINLNHNIPMADNRNQVWLQCRVWKALKDLKKTQWYKTYNARVKRQILRKKLVHF